MRRSPTCCASTAGWSSASGHAWSAAHRLHVVGDRSIRPVPAVGRVSDSPSSAGSAADGTRPPVERPVRSGPLFAPRRWHAEAPLRAPKHLAVPAPTLTRFPPRTAEERRSHAKPPRRQERTTARADIGPSGPWRGVLRHARFSAAPRCCHAEAPRLRASKHLAGRAPGADPHPCSIQDGRRTAVSRKAAKTPRTDDRSNRCRTEVGSCARRPCGPAACPAGQALGCVRVPANGEKRPAPRRGARNEDEAQGTGKRRAGSFCAGPLWPGCLRPSAARSPLPWPINEFHR